MKMIVLEHLATRSKGRSTGSACCPQSSVEYNPRPDATEDSNFALLSPCCIRTLGGCTTNSASSILWLITWSSANFTTMRIVSETPFFLSVHKQPQVPIVIFPKPGNRVKNPATRGSNEWELFRKIQTYNNLFFGPFFLSPLDLQKKTADVSDLSRIPCLDRMFQGHFIELMCHVNVTLDLWRQLMAEQAEAEEVHRRC